jgi:hypothetical protein
MATYRAYPVDGTGHVLHIPHTFDAADDDAAMQIAKQYVHEWDVELWQATRLVTRIEGRPQQTWAASVGPLKPPDGGGVNVE